MTYTLQIEGAAAPYLAVFTRREFASLAEAGLYMMRIGDRLTRVGAAVLHPMRLVDQDGVDRADDALHEAVFAPFTDEDDEPNPDDDDWPDLPRRGPDSGPPPPPSPLKRVLEDV